MAFIIRSETPQDYQAVYQLVKAAFAEAEHSDHDEQNLVERLRKSSAYLPDLCLVAESNGQIAGYIMFSRVKVGDAEAIALAPLVVSPQMQKQGIGSALIRTAHQKAKEAGYSFSIVLGHPDYYSRFGYRPAGEQGITAPFEVPSECFMALNLQNDNSRLRGVVEYDAAFFIPSV